MENSQISLFENLSEIDVEEIQRVFENEEIGTNIFRSMTKTRFKNILHKFTDLEFTENEYDELVSKIATENNALISWDDFITYLMLEFREKKSYETIRNEDKEITSPIMGNPIILKSHHRHQIVRLTFYPYFEQNEIDYLNGCYMSASSDGSINFWNLDMQLQKTVKSESLELKIHATQIMDLVCLFDVHVICTSSTERNLRFYDMIGNRFNICLQISSFPYAVTTMAYGYSPENDESKLLLGDTSGNVKVILFKTKNRGPFKSNPEVLINHCRYETLAKKGFLGMQLNEFRNTHSDWVQKIAYYSSLNSFISSSESSQNSMIIRDIMSDKNNSANYVFHVNKGVKCFALNEKSHNIVTGGLDTIIRVWNTFLTKHPSTTLRGHSTAIVFVTFMRKGQRVCSISKDKCVKVWNLLGSVCLQTYMCLASELTEQVPLAVFYNHKTQQVIIGAKRIAILTVSKRMNPDFTDGITHSKSVTALLYNSLFNCVVSCGKDSNIIAWNIYKGKKLVTITNAHFKLIYGEKIPIEISAACFDTSLHNLCTAAYDGTLKIWNFRAGLCLRHMCLDIENPITSIIWIENRIMVMGWNKTITEFSKNEIKIKGKDWSYKHAEKITCADTDGLQTLATGCYNGELILWALETGQPYKRINVVIPNKYTKIEYNIPNEYKEPSKIRKRKSTDSARKSSNFSSLSYRVSNADIDVELINNKDTFRHQSITAILFLKSRKIQKNIGTLLVAVENGDIQVWSHHASGAYLSSFSTAHLLFDYVTTMTTDAFNEFLFTGHAAGYIKVWLLSNFEIDTNQNITPIQIHRAKFAFLRLISFMNRAWRAVRNQKLPLLLSSIRGHMKSINQLVYVGESQLLLSASDDCSVRIWSIFGQYFGTLGTFKLWHEINPNDDLKVSNFQIPADINRAASTTTLNVLSNASVKKSLSTVLEMKKVERQFLQVHESADFESAMILEKLEEPVLGICYQLPDFLEFGEEIDLNRSVSYISAYIHLKLANIEKDVQKPSIKKQDLEIQQK